MPKRNDSSINKSVLVTGGAGYVGSHACHALARSGFRPIVFDNLSTGDTRAVTGMDFVKGDICNPDDIALALKRYKPVAVMHFAALTSAADSVKNPSEYYRTNVLGSKNVLDACVKAKINKFIFSSSAAVYGSPKIIPVTENSPREPINPYGQTKLSVEWMLSAYHDAYELGFIALRYFNAAGADPKNRGGFYSKRPINLIPLIMDILIGNQKKLVVYGTDYDTIDGTGLRDYVHVSDLAMAHVMALKLLLKGKQSLFLNLGAGCGYTVMEVVRAAERVSSMKIPLSIKNRRKGDSEKLIADISKAKRILQWKPVYKSIDEIVGTSFAWTMRGQKKK